MPVRYEDLKIPELITVAKWEDITFSLDEIGKLQAKNMTATTTTALVDTLTQLAFLDARERFTRQ